MSQLQDSVIRTDESADSLGCLSNLEALLQIVGNVSGLDILDVGCGDGTIVRELIRLGAHATGIDPHLVPGHPAELVRASAAAIPMPSASFDVVSFVFSLHHVPRQALEASLSETRRLLREGGKLYVAEPITKGPFQYLIEPFHDETQARADAARAMRDYLQSGFGEMRTFLYTERRIFSSFEAFVARMCAKTRINEYKDHQVRTPEVRRRFDELFVRFGGTLDQPVKVSFYSRS
ncbi:MAG: class I SAM-dependent methyltransferase [Rhizobiales bacterium]|nr:class I SAM-dependent methyltransferase [Hyphomicrobiales bacterium]